MTLLNLAALLTTAAAVAAAALALARTRRLRVALPVLLDLFTAAGLIRLAGVPSWPTLLVTALVIALRRLLTAGLHTVHG